MRSQLGEVMSSHSAVMSQLSSILFACDDRVLFGFFPAILCVRTSQFGILQILHNIHAID